MTTDKGYLFALHVSDIALSNLSSKYPVFILLVVVALPLVTL